MKEERSLFKTYNLV